MQQTIETVINLMAASAITAPKAGGKDCLEIVALTEADDLSRIAEEMRNYAHTALKRITGIGMLPMQRTHKGCC